MRASRVAGLAAPLGAGLLVALPGLALGHAERPAYFPDHRRGEVPAYRTSGPSLVACKPDSARRIRAMAPGTARERSLRLLGRCSFRHIQAAVDAARSGYRILVLPGVYREEPSRRAPNPDPRCVSDLIPLQNARRPQPTYEYHRRCPNAQNLIAVMGDGPDRDRRCDRRCNLQIEGTGALPRDVVIEGAGFGEDGGAKYTLVRADRADGIHLRNFTVQYADFNDVYVLETNGFRLDRLVTRWSREYGVLSFASDNGLYDRVVAYGNGDAGLYPGSGPEGHCRRYGIEIRRSQVLMNATGISGAAGNGVWAHHNRIHHNATGVFFTSLVPGHPGMPQDCAKWERNSIHSNNFDLYDAERDEYCNPDRHPVAERDPRRVCPAVALPVGTGFMLGGGNRNLIRANRIYDNRRFGTMQFYAPPGLRGTDETGQSAPPRDFDTSNANRYIDNLMGVAPGGRPAPNGIDFWWDGEGKRNCWSRNRAAKGRKISTIHPLSGCPRGNRFSPGVELLQLSLIPCIAWNPRTNPDPEGCDWMTPPPRPDRHASDAAQATRVTRGRVTNVTGQALRLRSEEIMLETPSGTPMRATASFALGFVHPLEPADRDAFDDLPVAERERLGLEVGLAPGESAPLTVAWRSGPPRTLPRIVALDGWRASLQRGAPAPLHLAWRRSAPRPSHAVPQFSPDFPRQAMSPTRKRWQP